MQKEVVNLKLVVKGKKYAVLILAHCDDKCEKVHEYTIEAQTEREARMAAIKKGYVPFSLTLEELIEVKKIYPWYLP
jgi:hypothetical protein